MLETIYLLTLLCSFFSVKVARRTWKFERMSYTAFTEFLNYSREAKELLGTSPLLKDQTGDRLQINGGYREPGDQMRMGNESKNFTQYSFSACSFTTLAESYRIGHFRVAFCLGFKTSPAAQPLLWE